MTKRRSTIHQVAPSSSPRLTLTAVRTRPAKANLQQTIRRHLDNLQILALARPNTARWVLRFTDTEARRQLIHDVATTTGCALLLRLFLDLQ